MRLTLLLLLLLCPALSAEIGLADRDGRGGWLLLQDPLGPGGEGHAPFAGDPGLPLPDGLQWPFAGGAGNGRYPTTELWRYDSGTLEFTRATHVLGAGDERRRSFKRTLYAVFAVGGVPHVLHFDPYQMNGGVSQVVKITAGAATAGGILPDGSILLNSRDYIDAPAVSPDGKHLALRVYVRHSAGVSCTIRVFRTSDWQLAAESGVINAGRPVWLNDGTLAVIEYEGETLPRPSQRAGAGSALRPGPSHDPVAGRLLLLPMRGNKLSYEVLLEGAFPPDVLSRSLLSDPWGKGLLLARRDGEQVAVEMREPKVGGKAALIGAFDRYRGMVVGGSLVRTAGVRDGEFSVDILRRHGVAGIGGVRVELPYGARGVVREVRTPQFSADEHGALLDFGRGVAALLEPVVSPHFDGDGTPLLAHTLLVLDWAACQSLRNPRQIAHLSGMVRRFQQVADLNGGSIPSSLLVYDLQIAANDGDNEKRGRYIELYGNEGRNNRGRIRTEDNLSGDWLVQSIDGDARQDRYYVCDNIQTGAMQERAAEDAGRVYDDLVTQLETRKLLMLTGVDRPLDNGGLRFMGRDTYRDPHSGATWRVWVYERFGREIQPGLRERAELRFVAGMPVGTAGTWSAPHAMVRARLRFALAGNENAAMTDLAFQPDRFVSLPDLTALGSGDARPELLLPATFRIYETGADGRPVERLTARAVTGEFAHPTALVRTGRVRAGYNVPLVNFGNRQFTRLQR